MSNITLFQQMYFLGTKILSTPLRDICKNLFVILILHITLLIIKLVQYHLAHISFSFLEIQIDLGLQHGISNKRSE